MQKTDFKKQFKELFTAPKTGFKEVDVPPLRFVKADGEGPPGADSFQLMVRWLFTVSYKLKFLSKKQLQRDYVAPPLQGLWFTIPATSAASDRNSWRWTLMIMTPDWITPPMFAEARDQAAAKMNAMPPSSLRLEEYAEGRAVQTMHIGPYSEEGPVIASLHERYLPEHHLATNGPHHEIYLGDPRKTAPEKLKTIIRQPVRPA